MKLDLLCWGPAAWASLLILTACGGPPAAESAATLPAPAAVALTDTPAPTASGLPADEAPAGVLEEAEEPTGEAPPPEAEQPALYKGIPQGATDDGFFYLGEAGTPATLTDYSDFL